MTKIDSFTKPNREYLSMEQLREEIKDLHKLHSVTKDFNHIIEYQPGSWKMFEPSKFIYSYFTFNTLYSYDWVKTVNEGKLCSHAKVSDDKGNEKEPTEGVKYKKMIDFIFENKDSINSPEFIEILLNPNKNKKQKTKEHLKSTLKNITRDNRITESDRTNFINEFEKLLDSEIILKGKFKNDLIRFIYLVRNNIFHGTKNTIEMTGNSQRKRLDIYSNFLIATNHLLFKSLEQKLNFKLDINYTIKL